MKPFWRIAVGAALLLVMAGSEVKAAWNNAFQVCCFGCRRTMRSHYTPPVVAHAAPSACCTTSYVQRCYYQPVTTYKTVMQPVTTYKTSYYYEPVCSYRSSCYYDPCTGSSVQVTTPVTSYRLRSQCNAVTSYVQRCVPVTSYRPTFYLEAVTSCAPPPPCPNPCPPGGFSGAAPGVTEHPPGAGDMIPRTNVPNVTEDPAVGGANPGSFRKPLPSPLPNRPIDPATMKWDKVVNRSSGGASVAGQVVAHNSIMPVSGAKLVFASREVRDSQKTVAADGSGRFQVTLASGSWSIYISRPDGLLDYHSSINIRDNENRNFRVVSR